MAEQISTPEQDRGGVVADLERNEAAKRPASRKLSSLRTLWPFVRRYPGAIGAALVFLLLAAGTTLYLPIAVRGIIDVGFTQDTAAQIDSAFFQMLIVASVLAVSSAARFFFVSWLGERVVADLRKAVYNHVISLSPAFFEFTRTGEVLSRLTTDTTLIQTIVGSSASIALRNTLTFIGSMGLLIYTSPPLAGMVLIGVPLVVLPVILVGRMVRTLSRRSQDRVADTSSLAGESLAAIQTVQAFTHEPVDRVNYGHRAEDAFKVAVRRITLRSAMTVIAIFMVFASIVGVLWSGARLVIDGEMSGGQLGQFMLYAAFLAGAIGALSEVWGELMRASGATERLVELLNVEPDIQAPANPRAMPEPARGSIRFDDVTFRYPTRPDTSALDGFSIEVHPGETVALVGPSGAGKSTVFQLLLRFYDRTSGRIEVDDCLVDKVSPQDLRGRMALVAQDPVVFATSAIENIRYSRPDASEEDVIAAAKAAAAHDFIMALPDGYQTQLGERGATLSGGQRQRIAIARALLRDAPILLLDEATSALDAESEQAVQQALEHVMEGRTTLVIAHRLATVLQADRIIVMEQGRVVAQGKHHELVAQGGLYARLARLQFRSTNDKF